MDVMDSVEGKSCASGGSCRGSKTAVMLGILAVVGLGAGFGAACAHTCGTRSAAPAPVATATAAPNQATPSK